MRPLKRCCWFRRLQAVTLYRLFHMESSRFVSGAMRVQRHSCQRPDTQQSESTLALWNGNRLERYVVAELPNASPRIGVAPSDDIRFPTSDRIGRSDLSGRSIPGRSRRWSRRRRSTWPDLACSIGAYRFSSVTMPTLSPKYSRIYAGYDP